MTWRSWAAGRRTPSYACVMQPSAPPAGDAVDDVAAALVLLVRGLKGLHAAVVARVGLRLELPAATALGVLQEHGRMRASELAEVLRVDLSGVSRQVAALEREGWVGREQDPTDSRAQLLHLTPAGTDVVRRVRADRSALLRELLPGWTDAELHAFAQSLRRFAGDLRAGVAGAPAGAR